jgi:hypothetical protein
MSGILTALAGVRPETISPTNIPGLLLWYDANSPANIISSGAYSQITDLSGNNNHATQSTPSNRPTQVVAAQNGLNTAQFSGSQYLNLTSTLNSGTSYTAFAVCKRTSVVEFLGNLSVPGNATLEWYTDDYVYLSCSAGYMRGPYQTSTAYNALYGLCTGTTGSAIYFNETSTSGSTGGGSGDPSNLFSVFGYADSHYCNGNIGEFGIYSGQVTASQLASLQKYIKVKWATP